MASSSGQEWTRTVVCPALDGLELVQAQFTTRTFPLHAHAETVIGAVMRGAKRSRVGFKELDVEPGMLTLFNPYEEHTSTGLSGSWTFVGMYPRPEVMARWFADLGVTDGRFRLSQTVCRDEAGAARIQKLHRTLSDPLTPFEAETGFVETIDYFFTHHGTLSPACVPKAEPGIARARERLDGDLSASVGLGELAIVSGLPAVKLLRGFRRAFGCTPHVYSMARRLAAAKRALAGGAAIADVAVRFGFCDQSHFTRVFHRWTGTSPGRFAAAAA